MNKSLFGLLVFWVAIFATMLFFACTNVNAQTAYRVEGNTYIEAKDSVTTYPSGPTNYYYESKGFKYQIYISKNGNCYINKFSNKTGNMYRQYLGESISRDICSKLCRTYQPKKK